MRTDRRRNWRNGHSNSNFWLDLNSIYSEIFAIVLNISLWYKQSRGKENANKISIQGVVTYLNTSFDGQTAQMLQKSILAFAFDWWSRRPIENRTTRAAVVAESVVFETKLGPLGWHTRLWPSQHRLAFIYKQLGKWNNNRILLYTVIVSSLCIALVGWTAYIDSIYGLWLAFERQILFRCCWFVVEWTRCSICEMWCVHRQLPTALD